MGRRTRSSRRVSRWSRRVRRTDAGRATTGEEPVPTMRRRSIDREAVFPDSGTEWVRLAFQFLLQLGEEAPVGALFDDLLRAALDHPRFLQTQREETQRII